MRLVLFVVTAAVGAAAVAPVSAQTAPPLADVKLVAEKSASFSEIAAAQKNGTNGGHNGNQNGNKGDYGYYGFYGYYGYARPSADATGAVGDVDLVDDREYAEGARR